MNEGDIRTRLVHVLQMTMKSIQENSTIPLYEEDVQNILVEAEVSMLSDLSGARANWYLGNKKVTAYGLYQRYWKRCLDGIVPNKVLSYHLPTIWSSDTSREWWYNRAKEINQGDHSCLYNTGLHTDDSANEYRISSIPLIIRKTKVRNVEDVFFDLSPPFP